MDNMRFKDLRKQYLKQYPMINDFLFSVKYGIERFLYRLSLSDYRDKFILKGGFLIGMMYSEGMRATKDLDVSFQNEQINLEKMKEIILDICQIDGLDNMSYEMLSIQTIKGNDIYPAFTIKLVAKFNHTKERIPFDLDVAVGDNITPEPLLKEIKLFIDEKKGEPDSIHLLAYPIPTILAEKLETILRRGTLNTRSKDFYDMHLLLTDNYDLAECLSAFKNTLAFRITDVTYFDYDEFILTLDEIRQSEKMLQQWSLYTNGDAKYAKGIELHSILDQITTYLQQLKTAYDE